MDGRIDRWAGMALVVALAGCAAPTATPTPTPTLAPSQSESPTATLARSTSPSPPASASPSPSAAPEGLPPSSEELIAGALSSGKIDLPTSLTYRAYALYSDERLPAEYRSPVMEIEAIRALANDVHDNEAQLAPQVLDEIAPFLARPNDPGSVFSQPRPQPVAAYGPFVAQAPVTFLGGPAAGGRARVWVRDSSDADLKLDGYIEVVSQVWTQVEKFLRAPRPDVPNAPNAEINPNDAVDIYFVGLQTVDPRRLACQQASAPDECTLSGLEDALGAAVPSAPWVTDPSSSGFALVQDGITGNELWGTVAHELFHVAQFAYDRGESQWLMESTASWAEFRILKELTLEPAVAHGRLESFFNELHVALTSTAGVHEYGAWAYFLSAQMDKGDSAVRSVWQRAAAPGAQGEIAAGDALPFVDNFPKFALRNYNLEPVDPRYSKADSTFPDVHARIDFETHIVTLDDATVSIEPTVNPLAARYPTFAFGDERIRSIVFNNTYAGNHDAAVQAVVFVKDKWHIEDWTGRQKVTFCRDIPAQDVGEFVVIISNSNLTQPLAPASAPTLEVKPDACKNWAGTVTLTYTDNMSFPGLEQKIQLDLSGYVTWKPDPNNIGAIHELEGSTVFLPVDGQITWQESGVITTPAATCTISGAGTYPIRNPEHYRFFASLEVLTDPATGTTRYWGHGLEPTGTALGDVEMSCSPSGVDFPPQQEGQAGSWLSMGGTEVVDAGGLVADANGGLTGTYTSDSSNQGTGIRTWTWNFQPSP